MISCNFTGKSFNNGAEISDDDNKLDEVISR